MDLGPLIKKRNRPPGPAPREWLLAAKLSVTGGSLFIGDPYYDPADALYGQGSDRNLSH
jgi:hypothetical protein